MLFIVGNELLWSESVSSLKHAMSALLHPLTFVPLPYLTSL